MRLFRVDLDAPASEAISAAADAVREGKVICYPTETIYGLGGNAMDGDVVRAINRAKGRPESTPCIVLILKESAPEWMLDFDRVAPFLKRFWPGPLTAIVDPPKRPIPPELIGPRGGLALRSASLALNISIIEKGRMPLISTSANRSGSADLPRSIADLKWLGSFCDIVIDVGELPVSAPSTVVDIRRFPEKLFVLREGAIPIGKIRRAFPKTEVERVR